MFSNNIWTNLPIEGLDSEGEDSAPTIAPDAINGQQAAAMPSLNSFIEEIDDGTFTTVPTKSRLTPKQRARKAKKSERLKQALMVAGTPKVLDQNGNGSAERDSRRELDTSNEQTRTTSKKTKKNSKQPSLEAQKAAEAERQKDRYIQQRPQATLEDFVCGYQRRGRN